MKTTLNADLRERWTDVDAGLRELDAARGELAQRLAADDGTPVPRSHVGRAHQWLSEALRFSGMLEESLEHKDAAIEIWKAQGKQRALFLVRLQRALVLAELDDPRAAGAMAALGHEMRDTAELEPFYRDFWLEYEARRLLWANDHPGAEQCLIEALEFRVEHRAARIVTWTKLALSKVQCGPESV